MHRCHYTPFVGFEIGSYRSIQATSSQRFGYVMIFKYDVSDGLVSQSAVTGPLAVRASATYRLIAVISVTVDVFTAVAMKNAIFWDVTPCGF
jgi:hypothetical protein